MGHDRDHPRIQKPREDFLSVMKDQQIRKLNQQVIIMADGVFGRMLDGVSNVFVGKVKIAARMEPRPARGGRRQFVEALGYALRLEGESAGYTFSTEDQDEGMKAFLERRAAKFTGR